MAAHSPLAQGTSASAARNLNETSEQKKNRPKATRLRQQQLPAWQPILTAKTVIPTVIIIGVIFIPIGVALLLASSSVQEWSSYYDNCSENTCVIGFDFSETFRGDVYFYYGLENYFQNHRRYMKSRSDKQLLGKDLGSVSECEPYTRDNNSLPYAPCGAIANSMFNDTFSLTYIGVGTSTLVPWTHNGLAWAIDKNTKFNNPRGSGQDLCSAFSGTAKPPNWSKRVCELDLQDPENNGFKNTDFIVWMRTAALPDFRKPYRKLVRDSGAFADGLPAGKYALTINNNYNVSSFGGRKSFIISTTSWVGGRNSFLGISYIVVGSICILIGIAFLVIHLKFGHSLSEIAVVN